MAYSTSCLVNAGHYWIRNVQFPNTCLTLADSLAQGFPCNLPYNGSGMPTDIWNLTVQSSTDYAINQLWTRLYLNPNVEYDENGTSLHGTLNAFSWHFDWIPALSIGIQIQVPGWTPPQCVDLSSSDPSTPVTLWECGDHSNGSNFLYNQMWLFELSTD